MRLNKIVHRKPYFFLKLKAILKQDFVTPTVIDNTLLCNHPSGINIQRAHIHV